MSDMALVRDPMAWVRAYYARNEWRCSVSCPMYSVVRDECQVLADSLPATECPAFKEPA